MIILEDLQWADAASLQLVRHVSAGVSGHRFLSWPPPAIRCQIR